MSPECTNGAGPRYRSLSVKFLAAGVVSTSRWVCIQRARVTNESQGQSSKIQKADRPLTPVPTDEIRTLQPAVRDRVQRELLGGSPQLRRRRLRRWRLMQRVRG